MRIKIFGNELMTVDHYKALLEYHKRMHFYIISMKQGRLSAKTTIRVYYAKNKYYETDVRSFAFNGYISSMIMIGTRKRINIGPLVLILTRRATTVRSR